MEGGWDRARRTLQLQGSRGRHKATSHGLWDCPLPPLISGQINHGSTTHAQKPSLMSLQKKQTAFCHAYFWFGGMLAPANFL